MTTNGAPSSDTPLARLSKEGQSVWVDFISRQALENGDLEKLIREDSVVGLTSNPTIFQKAIADGDAYDEQLREVLERRPRTPQEVFLELAKQDIIAACDLLRPIWDEGDGADGYVSLEVAPTLAYDAEGTFERGPRAQAADRPAEPARQDPGHRAGPPGDRGRDRRRHLRERDAALLAGPPRRGVRRLHQGPRAARRERGRPRPRSRRSRRSSSGASTPKSTSASSELGGHELRGKAAVANAQLAYQLYLEKFSGDAWQTLAEKGATPQRALWASTSTKNPTTATCSTSRS